MKDKMESIIQAVYQKYKAGLPRQESGHPDEETMACFLEGKLAKKEAEMIEGHIISCESCARSLLLQVTLDENNFQDVPLELIAKVKAGLNLAPEKETDILEIFCRLKDNLLELLGTNGDVLVGQELMPAPVLRSRKISNFKDEITLLKEFADVIVEIKIENKSGAAFSLSVVAKEKQTSNIIKDTRITLLKGDLELESYLADTGKATFEHVLLGKYKIEIVNLEKKVASIILDVKI